MNDVETITQYTGRLRDIANECFELGYEISNIQMMKKVLWSLPSKFVVKIATIEEAQDTNTMTLTILVGSLKVYEYNRVEREYEWDKNNNVAFKVETIAPMVFSTETKTKYVN